jgi:hypothetical protein
MEFEAITSQEQLDKVLGERLTRERAKFADYDDLKVKASRLDTIEAEKQTESEKTAKDIADLKDEVAKARRESARLRIATEHGISDPKRIALFLTGEDEATLVEQAKELAAIDADRATREAEGKKRSSNRVPKEGSGTTESKDDEMREFTRDLFGSADA